MQKALPAEEFIAELWSYANEVPMRTNPIFFGYIAINAVNENAYGPRRSR